VAILDGGFESRHPKDDSDHHWMKLDQWFQRGRLYTMWWQKPTWT